MMSRMNKINKQAETVKPEPKPARVYLKVAFGLVFAAAILAAFFMV